MSFRFGWFSTGRDEAAMQLLKLVKEKIDEGFIPGEISFVFCNRERGESKESDLFLDFVGKEEFPAVTFSSSRYIPDVRRTNIEQWRTCYHEEVMERIAPFNHDLIVLAGYMLIVSPEMCSQHTMLNLHPALPDGPKGTWEEVIDELILTDAEKTGVMMHLVTKDLDRGPVVTYCSFPIRGGTFDRLWKEHNGRGELFREIREEGVRREIPLIILTLKAFAEGDIMLKNGTVLSRTGNKVSGYSLTEPVEQYIKGTQ